MKQDFEKADSFTQEESAEFFSYFPTNLESARLGLLKYKATYEKEEVLRKATKFNTTKQILLCVIGLMPEAGFYWGAGFEELETEEEKGKLRNIYEKDFGLKVFHWPGTSLVSILNPKSVEKVIRNCPIPSIFPEEALRDPLRWVLENPSLWSDPGDDEPEEDQKIKTVRFGILSGYPPHASEIYLANYKINSLLRKQHLSDEELVELESYTNWQPTHNRNLGNKIKSKIELLIKNSIITPEQASILLSESNHFVGEKQGLFGSGFKEEDIQYFEQINQTAKILGINITSYDDQLFDADISQS